MLVLLFHIGAERWALEASQIKDVLPRVSLQTFSYGSGNGEGCGLLNYHGEQVHTIDVSGVVAGTSAPQALSTRIALVELGQEFGVDSGVKRLGLILDRASEMAQLVEASEAPMQSTYAKALLRSPNLDPSSGQTPGESLNSEVIPLLAIASLFTRVSKDIQLRSLR